MSLKIHWLALLAALAVTVPPAAFALAATPGQPGLPNLSAAANKDAAAAPASATEDRADLERKLDEAKAINDKLERGDLQTQPPPGITTEEVFEQRRLIDSLIFLYQDELKTLSAIDEENEKLKAAEAQAKSWAGFAEPPPYSMLMVYTLRDERHALRGKIAALESSLAILQIESNKQQADTPRADAAVRLADETTERAGSSESSARNLWRRDLAELRARVFGRNLSIKKTRAQLFKTKLAVIQAEISLLDRQIELARHSARLTDKDMETVKAGVSTAVNNFDEEIQKAQAKNTHWNTERDAALRDLDAVRKKSANGAETGEAAERVKLSKARIRAADAWIAASSMEIEILSALSTLQKGSLEFWGYQYILVNNPDPRQRQEALTKLTFGVERLHEWDSYIQDNLLLTVAEENRQQALVEALNLDAPMRRYEQDILDAYRLQRQVAERSGVTTDRIERMMSRWLDDYREQFIAKPWTERIAEQWVDLKNTLTEFAHVELFTVEDTVQVDGKQLTITRGVTLGKIFGACLLFFIGFWLARALSRHMQKVLVARFGIDEAQSNVLRRWALTATTLILLLLVLNWVEIPLTAFAFLGGALAIGVGFGTQTLLKNLISGVMVLLERKIKVGDIVEVDGVVGTVTEVDIRSSTLRGFDGVETVIPNATFIESKVTNWNYTSPKLRRSVRVGVAYGSPVREVIQILLDCADRHGVIDGEPAPFVWLEDFGDNALIFSLYFWIELGPKTNATQVMSDLRCMILDSFAKAGIGIPFPQRDIHFDSGQPLPVAVVSDGKPNQSV